MQDFELGSSILTRCIEQEKEKSENTTRWTTLQFKESGDGEGQIKAQPNPSSLEGLCLKHPHASNLVEIP